jgi:hypothetical protein
MFTFGVFGARFLAAALGLATWLQSSQTRNSETFFDSLENNMKNSFL